MGLDLLSWILIYILSGLGLVGRMAYKAEKRARRLVGRNATTAEWQRALAIAWNTERKLWEVTTYTLAVMLIPAILIGVVAGVVTAEFPYVIKIASRYADGSRDVVADLIGFVVGVTVSVGVWLAPVVYRRRKIEKDESKYRSYV